MEEELWKPVVGYEGFYEVSNLGNVRNARTLEVKKQYVGNNGYKMLRLGGCNKYKKKTVLVHKLVAEAWVENPNNLPCVAHIDESHDNNRSDNLMWVTYKENNNATLHKIRIKCKRKPFKSVNKCKNIICDGKEYSSLERFVEETDCTACATTVWRWLTGATKMPKEWVERGLRYDD